VKIGRFLAVACLIVLPLCGYGSDYRDHHYGGCSNQEVALTSVAAGAIIGGAMVDRSDERYYRDRDYRRPPPPPPRYRRDYSPPPCSGLHGYDRERCECKIRGDCRREYRY